MIHEIDRDRMRAEEFGDHVLVPQQQRGRAVALRGGTRGFKTGLRLTKALPVAWLPRVLARADRVSAAMQVRDYRGELMDPGPWRPQAIDAWTLLLSVIVLAGVVVMLCLR